MDNCSNPLVPTIHNYLRFWVKKVSSEQNNKNMAIQFVPLKLLKESIRKHKGEKSEV